MKVNKSEKGSSLVIVLGMLAVLMLMAVSFSVIMRVERAGTTNLRHNLTAQNGLQSAIAHALRDIDENLGDSMNPAAWEYGIMASNGDDISFDILQPGDSHDDVKVSILSERAQRHLNPTTRALVKNAKVDWRLLYAGIPLSNYAADGTDRLDEDSIVGRVAYVAVNTTGYLDPNMVSETGVLAFPEETHQLNNTSFAAIGKRNVGFSNYSFLDAREEEEKFGFTSFADLVTLNESLMYDDGRIKGAPKMFINFFPPNKTSCLFLPDVFGPAAAFGMSPYPIRMKDIKEYQDAGFEDWDALTEAVQIDGKKTLTQSDIEKIHIAFHSVFERLNWNEDGTYGEGKIEFDNPVTNVEWEFPRVGQMKNTLTRADLALLSFVEYYSYKSGRPIGNNEYLEMAIELINDEHGGPINKRDVSFNGKRYKSYLNAPCFKSVPMLSTVVGWTERPALKPDVIYRHNGGGKFTEVGDEAVIEPGTSTAKYYAKYELPVNFLIWAVNPYGRKAPKNNANMDVTILFGPEADGKDIFTHIQDGINGDPKIIIDPDETFRGAVEDPLEYSASEKNNTIKVEETVEEVITVYIQCPTIKTSPEETPLKVSDIKGEFSWEKAGFNDNLADYSIDVFMAVDISAGGTVAQAVPAPRLRDRGDEGPESYIHFKLPLFRKDANNHKCHRIGYAMSIDQRFAYATECLNEYRDGGLESFPYWVNNVMAESLGAFSELKSYEMGLDDPTEFTPTSNMAPDPTNPYAKLAMGYSANGDGEVNPAFWNGLMNFDSTGLDFGKPYPDTLHKVPGSNIYTANLDYDKSDFEVDWGAAGIESVGELGMLCIGPWETISLYRTQTPNNEYDFHTVLDFFTVDSPSVLMPGKVNLNAPPLLMTQEKSYGRVKFAMDHKGSYSNPKSLSIGGNVKPDVYVEASNGLNPEPLMAVLYGLGFDYRTSWEIASRMLKENIDYGSKEISFFKDISQLGYSDSAEDSILTYMLSEDNIGVLDKVDINPYSDFGREKLISRMAPYVTTRGQTFTIVIRSDAFTPKLGSDKEGVTLASKEAIVEAWRDTEPARDSAGEIVRDKKGNIVNYHNWHIRSVRIVE